MAFDSEVVAAVATEYDLSVADLEEALRDLQELVAGHAEVGGVDGLVYEWRRSYRRDPLVERTPDRYYLAVEGRVWADFDDRLGFDETLGGAVREGHARTVRAAVDDPERGVPLVLVRD